MDRYEREREREEMKSRGMPIGNLTSQIFANIYLNELDRFVVHTLQPNAYLRYGDDFIIIMNSRDKAEEFRQKTTNFLAQTLSLHINHKYDEIRKVRHGLHFLGVEIFPRGKRLNRRNQTRVFRRAQISNLSSYASLLQNHEKPTKLNILYWQFTARKLDDFTFL